MLRLQKRTKPFLYLLPKCFAPNFWSDGNDADPIINENIILHVMTSQASSNHSISAVRADVRSWPQLPPFKQKMSANHPSFVGAGFVSMVIHAFIAYLLCVVVADRTAVVGPKAPSIDAPFVVSLVSLPKTAAAPHDGLVDSETVSAVPSDPGAQYDAQSSPEHSRSIERKPGSESVMISKGAPGAEAPVGKSPAVDATPSIKLEAAGHIAREVVRIPEFEDGLVLASKGQRVMGPEAPEGKLLAAGTTPSTDLEAAIAREVERMSMTEFELQDLRSKSIALYQKNHPDVPSFAGGGLISIPFFLVDIITGNGYKWFKREALERQKDQERVEFMSDLMDVADTFKQ